MKTLFLSFEYSLEYAKSTQLSIGFVFVFIYEVVYTGEVLFTFLALELL